MNFLKLSSYAISSLLVLVTLTFLGFFFTDPLQYGLTALAVTQFISQFFWLVLIVVPPVLISFRSWNPLIKTVFLVAVLAWPVVLIVIRALLLIQTGDAYLSYLVAYPIFIFTDLLVPVIYVFIWIQRGKVGKGSHVARDEQPELQE